MIESGLDGALSEAGTRAALKVWGEWRASGCGRRDVLLSARAGAARRWAMRVERVLPLMEPSLRLVLAQTFVDGLSVEAARQDVRTRWSARKYAAERRRALAVAGQLLNRALLAERSRVSKRLP
ncbi:hypothetical protein [Methylomagnum ishizawai]|uniref:hypothetical protein n=1 Tax=Methylomagnum ishizawai TaxID=1760988 RepID=UPI001C81DE1E|nr:hypothetical protein [Methylomagnum ishizawai]